MHADLGYIRMGGGGVTLVTADSLEADAAVARPRHVVARGVVHTLAQLLAAVTEGPRWTFWRRSSGRIRGKDGTHEHEEGSQVDTEVLRKTLTEFAALPDEARPAGALTADVVAVGAVLAAAHLGTVGAVEPGRTTWGRKQGDAAVQADLNSLRR